MAVSFVTRLHKAIKTKEEKHPIVLQITWDRKVRRKRLGITAHIDQWDFENHEFRKGVHGRRELNDKLEEFVRKAEKIYFKHFKDTTFNYGKFIELFSEKPLENIGVIEFCLMVSDDFLKKGKANSSNDYKHVASAIRKVAPNDITFKEFDEDWLRSFEEYFTSRGTRCFNHMVHLRALFNKAVQRKIADFRRNPFKNPYTNPYGYDFSKLKKSRIAKTNPNRIKDLSKQQLFSLKSYSPKGNKEQEYMDVWWFSFYMFGVNLTDIANMKWSHIRKDRWFYQRSKTGTGLKFGKPILPEAKEIMERYKSNSDYVFPILTNGYDSGPLQIANRVQDYAGYIRKVANKISKRLEFEGYFTFYSARYSSATLALNEGADRNTVSHLLDHENFSTIDNYAGRADDEKVLKAMEILRLK